MNRKVTAQFEADGRVRLSGRCVVTGKPYSVVVAADGIVEYYGKDGNVAKAFPELAPAEREFLISGTSPEGWIQLFGEPEAASKRKK
jgi:hypothetical protein